MPSYLVAALEQNLIFIEEFTQLRYLSDPQLLVYLTKVLIAVLVLDLSFLEEVRYGLV
jgi:hypothetical protein